MNNTDPFIYIYIYNENTIWFNEYTIIFLFYKFFRFIRTIISIYYLLSSFYQYQLYQNYINYINYIKLNNNFYKLYWSYSLHTVLISLYSPVEYLPCYICHHWVKPGICAVYAVYAVCVGRSAVSMKHVAWRMKPPWVACCADTTLWKHADTTWSLLVRDTIQPIYIRALMRFPPSATEPPSHGATSYNLLTTTFCSLAWSRIWSAMFPFTQNLVLIWADICGWTATPHKYLN